MGGCVSSSCIDPILLYFIQYNLYPGILDIATLSFKSNDSLLERATKTQIIGKFYCDHFPPNSHFAHYLGIKPAIFSQEERKIFKAYWRNLPVQIF